MNSDPILNFRINSHLQVWENAVNGNLVKNSIQSEAYEITDENFQMNGGTTMITETREAVDSSEHA